MTEETPTPKKAPAKKPAAAKAPATSAAAKKAPATKAAAAKAPAAKAPAAKAPAAKAPAAAAPAAPIAAPMPPAPVVSTPPPPPPVAAPQPPAAPQTPVGPTPMLESDARMWAMLLHVLSAVVLVVTGGVLAFAVPLVIWLIYRERSALIDFHGKQNLNLQLTSLLIIVAGSIIGLITFGFGFILTLPLMLLYGLYALIISVVAGVKANGGEYYRIPAAIPFIR